jgi:hypothetical protein
VVRFVTCPASEKSVGGGVGGSAGAAVGVGVGIGVDVGDVTVLLPSLHAHSNVRSRTVHA